MVAITPITNYPQTTSLNGSEVVPGVQSGTTVKIPLSQVASYTISLIGGVNPGVLSFDGRAGAVTLQASDVSGVGGALLASPTFTGTPAAPTASAGTNTTQIATTAFVANSFAPIFSPTLTGTPAAPTAVPGTNTTQVATTQFVTAAIVASTTGVSSFNTRTGAIVLAGSDVSAAGGALVASPALTGTPTAPTAALNTSTTQIATTAFVEGQASTTTPLVDGSAAIGTRTTWARADHVHPTDTSRFAVAGGTVTGSAQFNGAFVNVANSLQSPTQTVCGSLSLLSSASSNLSVETAGSASYSIQCARNSGTGAAFMAEVSNTNAWLAAWVFGGTTIANITTNGSTVAYNTSSDYRLKTIHGGASDLVGAMLDGVPVHDAEWNRGESLRASSPLPVEQLRYPMFLAHELQVACPWAVTGDKDAVNDDGSIRAQQVDASKVIPLLWAEVQNLRKRVAALESP